LLVLDKFLNTNNALANKGDIVKQRVLLLFVVLIISSLSGCMNEDADNDGKIGVLVTIPPQAEFVENVGKERVDVMVMIPSGASPHAYTPTPSQLKVVSEAEIYFKVGTGVEFEEVWLDKIIAMNPDIIIIDGSRGISKLDGDPHIWNSPINARKMVENFYTGLIIVDPDNSGEYGSNKDEYLQKLDDLDEYIHERLDGFTDRTFMIYHPSFGYFAQEYNLTQIAVEHGGKEPTPQVMQNCIDEAEIYNFSYVYVAPQFTTQGARTIAHEIGGEILFIDPLSTDYITNMQTVADQIALELE